ncbi:MAG: acyltransferase [Fibrobacter sp.]|nr:acyltransferase [Fibrobacter sp.]
MIKIIKKIVQIYKGLLWSKEKQARKSGVTIGKNCFIRSHFWSAEPYLITVGNNCAITPGVKFFTHGGARAARAKYPKFDFFGKINIGNYVYIGTGAMIMAGVSVGDNVLIAAGSVVTKSIPSNVVVGGNPAKILCPLDVFVERNMKYNTNSKGMSYDEKKKLLLSLPEEMFIKKKMMEMPKK